MIKCVAARRKSLVASEREQYGCRASAKSDAGISLLTLYWRHMFICCSTGCTSMVGRAEAS